VHSNKTVSAHVVLSALDYSAGVLVTNVSDETIVILEGTPLGVDQLVNAVRNTYAAAGNVPVTLLAT
jgi:hypothetical protein